MNRAMACRRSWITLTLGGNPAVRTCWTPCCHLVEIGAVRKRPVGRSYPRYAKSRAWAERNVV